MLSSFRCAPLDSLNLAAELKRQYCHIEVLNFLHSHQL